MGENILYNSKIVGINKRFSLTTLHVDGNRMDSRAVSVLPLNPRNTS